MKRFIILLWCAISTLSVLSCGKSNEEDGSIIGTWQRYERIAHENGKVYDDLYDQKGVTEQWEFQKKIIILRTDYDEAAAPVTKYSYSFNQITGELRFWGTKYDSYNEGVQFFVLELTSNSLVIKTIYDEEWGDYYAITKFFKVK